MSTGAAAVEFYNFEFFPAILKIFQNYFLLFRIKIGF